MNDMVSALRDELATVAPEPMFCPECSAELIVHRGRSGKFFAHHPAGPDCPCLMGTWGFYTSRHELHAVVARGDGPLLASAEARAVIGQWIELLMIRLVERERRRIEREDAREREEAVL